MNGLCKESQNDFRSLSTLPVSLRSEPQMTLSHGQVMVMPVIETRERGFIPKASEEKLRAVSSSQMKVYKHATAYKWTFDDLIAIINLIKSADFKVEDVIVNLHNVTQACGSRSRKGTFHEP
jgi:hypothetical protein